MTRSPASAAFSLAEILICMGMMSVILGCLLSSSLTLQKTLQGCETYASSYSDQRRIIDFVSRDLRRAIAVSATDAAGNPQSATAGPIDIENRATLTVTLPGYYQSNVPTNPGFDAANDVVSSGGHVDYGTSSGPATPVTVIFRKIYSAQEGCICFIRQEAADERIIVRAADNLHVRTTIAADGRNGEIKAWFLSPFSRAQPLVSTYDTLMLRNPLPTP